MWDYRAQLIEVEDGDTIRVLLDNGLGSRQEESIRLKGVWAPDEGQPGREETKAECIRLIETNSFPSLKWPLHIWTEKNTKIEPTEKRSFTRYIGTVRFFGLDAPDHTLNNLVANFLVLHPEYPGGIGAPSAK
jgi:hypothetical protein